MSLKHGILEDVKTAMKAQEKERLGILRLITAAIKQREVDERIELNDAQVFAVIEKMIKQRREAIAQFEKGGRADLVAKEQNELVVLQAYMPAQLSEAEIDTLIADSITNTQAGSMKDMGKVMADLKEKIQGRADAALVSQKIKAKLT